MHLFFFLDKRPALTLCFFIALQVIIFLTIHFWGVVDGDEGFYLMASFLVNQGKRLYIDFYYPQMPLFPYIYAGWMQLFGFTWEGGRSLSWVFSVGILFLLHRYFKEKIEDDRLLIILLGCFLFNGLVMGWMTTAKTYASSTFFTLLGFICLRETLLKPGRLLGYFLGGLSLGIAGNLRLLFLPLIVPVLLWLIWTRRGKDYYQTTGLAAILLLGWLLACLISIYYFILDPYLFYWNNLGCHLIRYPHSKPEILLQKVQILGKLMISPQFCILLVGFVISFLSLLKNRSFLSSQDEWGSCVIGSFLIGASIFIINLIPSPALIQYFSVLPPFLLITTVPLLKRLWYSKEKRKKNLLKVVILFYFVAALPTLVFHGIARPHREDPQTWSLASVKAIGKFVRLHSNPGDTLFAQWPGCLFTAGRNPLPGMENHFGYLTSWRLSASENKYYHLASQDRILLDIAQKKYSLAILGGWIGWPGLNWTEIEKELETALIQNEYTLRKEIGEFQIYSKPH